MNIKKILIGISMCMPNNRCFIDLNYFEYHTESSHFLILNALCYIFLQIRIRTTFS